MSKERLKVELTFTEPLLGTCPGNPELYSTFIGSKSPDPETNDEAAYIEDVEDAINKAATVFARENGRPFLWDYCLKGLFKSRCYMLKQEKDTLSHELTNYRKLIAEGINVYPRKMFLELPDGGKMEWLERSLRVQTPKGERVCLARSEVCPPGTWIDCEIEVPVLAKKGIDLMACVKEWLNEGVRCGLGQWRTAGNGRFTWREME